MAILSSEAAGEVRPENRSAAYSLPDADHFLKTEKDTLDLPYSEPVAESRLNEGSEFEESALWIYFGHLSFTNESMSDAYESVWLGAVEGMGWGKRFGGSIELGYMQGDGKPALLDSEWVTNSSWIKMKTVFIGINALYSLRGHVDKPTFRPYVGLGPALWIGTERIAAGASRESGSIWEEFEAEALGLGVSFGGCVVFGSSIRVADDLGFLIEVRGVLSSSGSVADLVDEEEQELIDSTLYRVVERTDFSFTGWQINFGVRW
jgi:hypothetical protein